MGTDDAFAFMLLKYFGLDPDYIIATGGNASNEGAVNNAVALVGTLGLSSTVVRGYPIKLSAEKNTFHGIDGLAGRSEEMCAKIPNIKERLSAVLSLDELYKKLFDAQEIRYIVIGPLTSLSHLLDKSGFTDKLTELDLMGGGFKETNCAHNTEFNFSKNPPAVKRVLSCECPIVLFPLDLTNFQTVPTDFIDKLEENGTYPDFIAFLRHNAVANAEFNHIPAAVLHDAMPVLYVRDSAPFVVEEKRIAVDEYGRTYEDASGALIRLALHADISVLHNALQRSFAK